MKILCVGAGGIGGYFGARLLEAGANVTFLLRPVKAKTISQKGLSVKSPLGDWYGKPPILEKEALSGKFDIVVLSCKAYDLTSALVAIEPIINDNTVILPFLNGIAHLEIIAQKFKKADVWGGVAHLGVSISQTGEVLHFNKLNDFLFGPLHPNEKNIQLAKKIASVLKVTPVNGLYRIQIQQDMWDKLVFLGTLAGITCLMRADIGTILKTSNGEFLIRQLLNECVAIAKAEGYSPELEAIDRYTSQLTDPSSTSTSSLLRDVINGGRTEGGHILGDLFCRAKNQNIDSPLLHLCKSHVNAYEIMRELG